MGILINPTHFFRKVSEQFRYEWVKVTIIRANNILRFDYPDISQELIIAE